LKLFTFLSLDEIKLLMGQQRQDESKRVAQHILAKEIVELAHGAKAAKTAESAHKEAFSHGTNTFSVGALRHSLSGINGADTSSGVHPNQGDQALLAYKKAYAASSNTQAIAESTRESPKSSGDNIVTLPAAMLQPGSFPRVLHAAGLASSKSEAHRLIAKKGAYVVVPNSGSPDTPSALQWITIETSATANPSHFLVDWEALVLRSGKSKIQICRVIPDEQFEAEGLTCPGWEGQKTVKSEAE
jgi:tyrosyl-tRNA synthetase